MRVTFGKVIWSISFIIFLIVAYNMNTFERLWDIIVGEKTSIVQVDEYNPFEPKEKSIADSTTNEIEKSFLGVAGSSGIIESDSQPESVQPETSDIQLYLKVERMTWNVEQLKEKITELEVQVAELTADKDTTIDNLIAILSAVTPLLLPFLTRKFGNHDKEIKLGK